MRKYGPLCCLSIPEIFHPPPQINNLRNINRTLNISAAASGLEFLKYSTI